MRSVEEVTARLRNRGLRATPQRACIVRLLQDNHAHPTVESLYEAARAELPTISLKTVYQTVHDLETLGELRTLDVGTGSLRVEPNAEREHHHLVCTVCGEVRDVPVDLGVDRTAIPARHRGGFTIESVEVVFRGRCDTCAASGPDRSTSTARAQRRAPGPPTDN